MITVTQLNRLSTKEMFYKSITVILTARILVCQAKLLYKDNIFELINKLHPATFQKLSKPKKTLNING